MKILEKYTDDKLSILEKYSRHLNTLSYFYKPSFVHLWAGPKDIYIHEGEYGLYIYLKALDSFLMPWSENMPKAIEELERIAKEENLDLRIFSIPKEYIDFFDDDRFILNRSRGYDEYLYLQEKLIGLSGRSLQSKRNHISQFFKAHPNYSIESIKEEHFDSILKMTRDWIASMPLEFKPDLEDEYATIEKALSCWKLFDFSGSLLLVDGEIAAYTIGERQKDQIVVHYEKANTAYHGAYPTINREYQLNTAPREMYVNRMEDDDIEGLRRAKESYKPILMVEKWDALLK